VSGNKVLATGATEEIVSLAGKGAELIDLQGRTVLPGFIEPHIHFNLLAMTSSWLDIGARKYPTTAGALQALKEHIASRPGDDWVFACNFDPSLQDGPAVLTTRELDQVSASRPIFVMNASSHLAYVNSALLKQTGVDASTPNPPGGEYYRYPDGAPNGAMTQGPFKAILLANERIRHTLVEGADESVLAVGEMAAERGITTLCDAATGAASGYREFADLQAMHATGRMKARIRAHIYWAAAGSFDEAGIEFGAGDALVQATGFKIVADGSNQGFTGRQREPYFNSDNLGMFYVKPTSCAGS
jgi:predicted amidohydrolase YtcJ